MNLHQRHHQTELLRSQQQQQQEKQANDLYHARLINFASKTIPNGSEESNNHVYDDLSGVIANNGGEYCTAYDDEEYETDVYSKGVGGSFGQPSSNEKLLYKLIMTETPSAPVQPPPQPPQPTQQTSNPCFSSSSTSSGLSCSSSSVLSNTAPNLANSASLSSLLLKTTSSSSSSSSSSSTSPPSTTNQSGTNNNVKYSLISAQLSKKSDEYHIDLLKASKLADQKPRKSAHPHVLPHQQSSPDILVLRPSHTSTSTFHHNLYHHQHAAFDSTLLTPLNKTTRFNTTAASEEASGDEISQSQSHSQSHSATSSPTISAPFTLAPSLIECEESGSTSRPSSSSHRLIGPKSTSASYLLSKISSLANLTMAKNQANAVNGTNTIVSRKSSSALTSSSSQNNTTIGNNSSSSTTLMGTLANRLFSRKTSTSSNHEVATDSGSSSPILSHSSVFAEKPTSGSVKQRKTLRAMKSSSTTSAGSLSSRDSSFKKRSQSIHSSGKQQQQQQHDEKTTTTLWIYNQNDDYWYSNQIEKQQQEQQQHQQIESGNNNKSEIMLKSIGLIKRKHLITSSSSSCSSSSQMSSPVSSSSNTHSPNNLSSSSASSSPAGYSPSATTESSSFSISITRIRLTVIPVKYLTLIEIKYLKQICFNRVHNYFDDIKPTLTTSTSSKNSSKSSHISLSIPKDESTLLNPVTSSSSSSRRSASSSNKRSKSVDFRFFEDFKENYFPGSSGSSSLNHTTSGDSSSSSELVFGQSLYKCIVNDLRRQNISSGHGTTSKRQSRRAPPPLIASKHDLTLLNSISTPRGCDEIVNRLIEEAESTPTTPPVEAVPYSFANKRNSVLFEALDLKNITNTTTKTKEFLAAFKSSSHQQPTPQPSQQLPNQNLAIRCEGLVPNIVKSCCRHISEFGLDVVGIFRIDSSKKRIKELKEMYDTGREVVLNDLFNPNDAACLLKEYLRSLPEPLLTRELYSSFIAANKISDAGKKLEIIRSLVGLLPVANRDTLELILKLLDQVRKHSQPIMTAEGKQIGGNKMDAFNLAMVFGPNLLKKSTTGSSSSTSSSSSSSTQDKFNLIDDIDAVISVTKFLIENQTGLFTIDASLHNEIVQTISRSEHSTELNSILMRKLLGQIGVQIIRGDNNVTSTTVNEDCSSASSSSCSYCDTTRPPVMTQLNKDFIDAAATLTSTKSGLNGSRTSRTRLHKISSNDAPPATKMELIKSYTANPNYSTFNPRFYREETTANNPSSSILLMIQQQQQQKQLQQQAPPPPLPPRRFSDQHSIQSNSKTMYCTKYYDKTAASTVASKFNVIGEQETLV